MPIRHCASAVGVPVPVLVLEYDTVFALVSASTSSVMPWAVVS